MPIDDQRQGLAEHPTSTFIQADAAAGRPDNGVGRRILPFSRLDRNELKAELEIASRYGAVIERVAVRYGLLPSVIAGLGSRRSGWGRKLSPIGPGGTSDRIARRACDGGRISPFPRDGLGFERGFMGLDYDWHEIARTPHWREPEANIDAAGEIIASHRTWFRRHTTLQGIGLLRASLSAFECGLDQVKCAIRLGQDVDISTLGRRRGGIGCGRDVLTRAEFFQTEGWD